MIKKLKEKIKLLLVNLNKLLFLSKKYLCRESGF